jgi:hypothetical protein
MECQIVYVWEDDSVWKFTPAEWWAYVSRAIRNDGSYEHPFTSKLQGHGKHVAAKNSVSRDKRVRCVNVNGWALTNWVCELNTVVQ